jgi:hypothetical protein
MDLSIARHATAGLDPKRQRVELAVAAQSTGALYGRGLSTHVLMYMLLLSCWQVLKCALSTSAHLSVCL